MESEMLVNNYQPCTSTRLFGAAGPVLWIATSYMDPGKWATAVEGGARFGVDIALLLLVINCVGIFCQYLSARIAIVTGKDLAQICREEYDDRIYALLGIQAETSMLVLDLSTVLGTACGLYAVSGINLYSCVFLTSIHVVLFPFLASHFENSKAKLLSICLGSCILVSYVYGIVRCQPETSLSFSGALNKLQGRDSYLLMALLGANILPHNFYLHSSIVQQGLDQTSTSIGSLVQEHFIVITSVFSVIFLGNMMLMNWASLVFYSDISVSLTLSDALSMLDQVSGSSITLVSVLLIMLTSNLLISLPWSCRNRLISQNFFKLDISCWVQRAVIRLFASIIAIYCVGSSGVGGIFQLLIFTQVFVGLLLPSAVLPLYKVASSKAIMGVHRVSHLSQFLALGSLIGILLVKVTFLYEMVYGDSDWANSLSWNMGGSFPMMYSVFLLTAFICSGFVICLIFTSLKSDEPGVNTQELARDENGNAIFESPGSNEIHYEELRDVEEEETELSFDENQPNLPETFMDSERNPQLATIQEHIADFTFPNPSINEPEASAIVSEATLPVFSEVKTESLVSSSLSIEPKNVLERSLLFEGDVQNEEDVGETWEPEESNKYINEINQNLNSEGSGSSKSLGGKLDDVGSGTGSLSRLAGLGRAARRQLTTTLDEFWGQLFDFHGQITQDARAKKLDSLLGIVSKPDSKSSFAPTKIDTLSKESAGYFSSPVARVSDSIQNSSFYNPSLQQIGQNNIGSPMWSNQMQQLDAYVRKSNQSGLDSSERRYNSVRHVPSSYDAYDYQPATIHGCDMASYLNRTAKENGSDSMKGQLDSPTRIPGHSNTIDPYSRFSGQTPQNGLRMTRPPGFHNVPISRNTSLKSGKPILELLATEQVDFANNTTNEKKYYSMPDISGRYVPNRDAALSGNRMDYSTGPGQFINRQLREQTLSTASSWGNSGLGLNEVSSSKVRSDAFSVPLDPRSGSSLWSRQPYERFGVADKSPLNIMTTPVDMEPKILRSLRICINKLLRLEGSNWLFRQNDGADEDLIDRVAAREKFVYEVETRASALKPDEVDHLKIMSVPNCGEACVWRVDLVTSFGVWCIHRILELSLMESRPELWGKYTYVLNRLQGIVDLAFSKPRTSVAPCFCLLLPAGYQQKSSQAIPNDGMPPTSKLARGKFTTAPMLLEMIKDVEIAISCRKGRTGTAAGDVAFPKGKENLASVLKRYKRRLSNRPIGSQDTAVGSRKIASPPPQGL